MGKQGPCCHCGVTSTPLWRNGPTEKPVLCNACGSRWRTRGTLVNYMPIHARADADDYPDNRFSRMRSVQRNKTGEVKLLKRKQNHDYWATREAAPNHNQSSLKVVNESPNNKSSSGSATSNSDSCAHFGSTGTSDLAGPSQSAAREAVVPSRKRTRNNLPKPSTAVEKLTEDLYTILHEQQSCCFSGSSDGDLIFDSDNPMVSVEIGHGSILIRHPCSIIRDEESEASSLSFENKKYSSNADVLSHSLSLCTDKKSEHFSAEEDAPHIVATDGVDGARAAT